MVSVRFDKMQPASVLKSAIPSLQVRTLPRISNEGLSESQKKDPGPLLIGLHPSATVQGIPIDSVTLGSGLAMGQPLESFGQREAIWNLRLPRYVIDAIEGARQNDVQVVVSMEFLCWLPGTPENRFPWNWTNAQFTEEISQSRWLSILEDLGYASRWLVEIPRPRITGMDAARKSETLMRVRPGA